MKETLINGLVETYVYFMFITGWLWSVNKRRGGGNNSKKKAIANTQVALWIRNDVSDWQRPQGRRHIKDKVMFYYTKKKKKKGKWQWTAYAPEFPVPCLLLKPSEPNPRTKIYEEILESNSNVLTSKILGKCLLTKNSNYLNVFFIFELSDFREFSE